MELNGIPLHPLVVHAAVVFAPTSALTAIAYALVPRWRWVLRWPLVVVAVASAASVQLAAMTGDDLAHTRGLRSALIETHEMWAGRLQVAAWVLAALAAVAWWGMAVPARTGVIGRTPRLPLVDLSLRVLLPLAALAVLFLVYQTGDAGARAVWGS